MVIFTINTGQNKAFLQDVLWMGSIYVVRLGSQALSFIFLARTLGSTIFGEFMAVYAVCNLVAPFVEMGAYNLSVRDITSRNIDTRVVIGNSLLIVAFLFPVGLLVSFLLKIIILPDVLTVNLIFIASGIFYGNRLLLFANGIYMAHKRLARNLLLELVSGLCLIVSVLLLSQSEKTFSEWSIFFFAQSFLAGSIALMSIIGLWGIPQVKQKLLKEKLVSGFHFAVSGATSIASSDLDKSLLARLASFEISGLYSAAYRIIVISTVPLSAIMGAAYPRFFIAGATGLKSARSLALKLLPLTVAYGVVTSILLFICSPIVSLILGDGFAKSEEILKLLSFLVIILAIQMPLAEVLTGSGYQKTRTVLQLASLFINIILNVILIPTYSWKGSLLSVMISQSMLLLFYVYFIFLAKKRL